MIPLAIGDVHRLPQLLPIRRHLEHAAHFSVVRRLLVGHQLASVPVCCNFLVRRIFRLFQLAPVGEKCALVLAVVDHLDFRILVILLAEPPFLLPRFELSASREFFNFCRASSLSSLLNCQSPSMLGRGLASGFLGIAGGAGAFVELTSDGGGASGPGGACAFAAHAQTRHAPLATTALPNCLIFVTFLWLELQDYPEWPSLATVRRFRHLFYGHIP